MVFSTFHLLNVTYQGYVIVASLTLLFSYSSNRSFFAFSATSWVILKTISLYCTKSKKSKSKKGYPSSSSNGTTKQSGNKNNKIIRVLKTIFGVDSLFNSSGQNRFGILISTIVFIVFQEILVWSQLKNVQTSSLEYMNSVHSQQSLNDLTLQGSNTIHHSFLDYSLHLNLFHLLFISQIFIGILLKSACALNIFLGISEEPLNKLDFWNLISYFLSLSSLHGLFGMIYNLQPSLIQYLVAFRVISVIFETTVIHVYKMNFFSTFPQKPLKVGATLSLIQIFLMFPIDYSPFYADEWKINDYKTSDMYTQTSRFIIKISQTFETVFLMYLCYQTESAGQFLMQGLMGFFYFSGFCSIILSICHFFIKTKEIITKDYQFLKQSAMTVEKIIKILNNSKKIMILDIENISDSADNLENNFCNQQLLLRGLLKHTKQSTTSKEFSCITIAQIAQSFNVNSNYICIQSTAIFDAAFFSELADPSRPLPFCRLRITQEKLFSLAFQKSLIKRLFAEGVTEGTKKLIELQHPANKAIGQGAVNWFLRGYLTVIAFEKNLSHVFVINPKQVLHDLWFDDEQMKHYYT